MTRIVVGALACLVSITCASAGIVTGNTLLSWCDYKSDSFNLGACLAYINGVLDSEMDAKALCPPAGVTLGQVKDMVLKYLKEKPDLQNRNAPFLIYGATSEFACAQGLH